jgi:hypothetical protein
MAIPESRLSTQVYTPIDRRGVSPGKNAGFFLKSIAISSAGRFVEMGRVPIGETTTMTSRRMSPLAGRFFGSVPRFREAAEAAMGREIRTIGGEPWVPWHYGRGRDILV